MKKNLYIETQNKNLLNSRDFISHLKFEVNYASIAKGGHSPYYFPEEKKKRLVSDVNLFSSNELQSFASDLFINNN